MMEYEMEELLPIVAQLSEQYTRGESTSVTYEKARQFMEAVLYCMKVGREDCSEKYALGPTERIPAETAYRFGVRAIARKIRRTREQYNEMMEEFRSYGNENYQDTVAKAIPGFFLYYDIKFAPQETIITMDYPTLKPIGDQSGICAVETYVNFIRLEQKFMNRFPETYLSDLLDRYDRQYRKQFYNICQIVLRHVLACMAAGKKEEDEPCRQLYERLKNRLQGCTGEQLKILLENLVDQMVLKQWDDDRELADYLKADAGEFAGELLFALEYDCLEVKAVL